MMDQHSITMNGERLTVFAGHYGSGKTSLALSYAAYIKQYHHRVAVADLDIINPYFRASGEIDYLNAQGIQLIAPSYARSNLEAPAISAGVAALFDDKDLYGIIDLGGDDRGAYAIGRYSERIAEEDSKSILLVINCYRPLSNTPKAVADIRLEIESAAGFKFTGIVNNSNLGRNTTAQDVLASAEYVQKTCELTGLALAMTSVREDLYDQLKDTVENPFRLYKSI